MPKKNLWKVSWIVISVRFGSAALRDVGYRYPSTRERSTTSVVQSKCARNTAEGGAKQGLRLLAVCPNAALPRNAQGSSSLIFQMGQICKPERITRGDCCLRRRSETRILNGDRNTQDIQTRRTIPPFLHQRKCSRRRMNTTMAAPSDGRTSILQLNEQHEAGLSFKPLKPQRVNLISTNGRASC